MNGHRRHKRHRAEEQKISIPLDGTFCSAFAPGAFGASCGRQLFLSFQGARPEGGHAMIDAGYRWTVAAGFFCDAAMRFSMIAMFRSMASMYGFTPSTVRY